VIEFLPQYAPRHVAHFKELARQGFFDGTKIHRLVKDKNRPIAIQGGDPNTISGEPSTWGQGQPGQQTVPAEFSKSITHDRGIVSAARKPNDPDSATSQFFICASAMPSWDGQYSIFGRVIEGMNVVYTIGRAPLWPNTADRPMDPVVVTRFYLAKKGQY
jgi:cyclophilin family peptidyl-prolyl cis-trans isomerase